MKEIRLGRLKVLQSCGHTAWAQRAWDFYCRLVFKYAAQLKTAHNDLIVTQIITTLLTKFTKPGHYTNYNYNKKLWYLKKKIISLS